MPKSTKITRENVEKRIRIMYPNSLFTLIKYEKASTNLEIRCERCGKIHKFSRLSSATARINLCSCFKEFNNTKEKIDYLLQKYNFSLLQWNGSGNKMQIQCNNCKQIGLRFPNEILRNPCYCQDCNNSKTTPLTLQDVQLKIDEKFDNKQYKLLNYENWRTKVNIKHLKCNTIFKQNIEHFLEGCGCPRCNRKRSRGEQEIAKWLSNNFIKYESQYSLKYKDNSKGYLDFFIPILRIAIEYNGEQHYNKNNFFNQKENKAFLKQQERDKKKREYCQENNIELLEIPYWQLDEISKILSSKFNDYLKKE